MISRRTILKLAGLGEFAGSSGIMACGPRAAAAGTTPRPALSSAAAPDYRLEIASTTLELSAHDRITTVAYNGMVPGPVLRFKENQPVTIEVVNRSRQPEVVHWHGLFLPPDVDGAMEEGTRPIAPNATVRYRLVPRPAGFRWYHTHTMAMDDLTRAQYGGQHGFLMVEPRENPARYDQEWFLALHDWGGYLQGSDDGAMNPSYRFATINGKRLGSGEPLRVEAGQRVLVHVLNSSPTEVHWLALAGHSFTVVALDGNAVPNPLAVPMLRLAPAERVCALVEMNNPGVWILGEVRRHVQAAGMGVLVEYANASGAPRWDQPGDLSWSYQRFAIADATPPAGTARTAEAPQLIPLVIEAKFRGHGGMEGWLLNGKSYPEAGIAPLVAGRRYRLRFINRSKDDHPLHLHRHSFELRRLGAPLETDAADARPALGGIIKDVVLVDAGSRTDVDFTADNPGATLLHCHQQNHMDLGFMMLIQYA